MKCYLCKSEAKDVKPTGDSRGIQCESCGEYKIAGTSVAMVETRNVDTQEMQVWLTRERSKSHEIPMISSINMVYK